MRRLAGLLLVAFALLLLPVPESVAQEPAVRLTLVAQTPWNSTIERTLEVKVRAQNLSDQPLTDLSVGWTLWGPVFTRTDFEDSLTTDPESAVAIAGNTIVQEGTIEPGGSRVFTVRMTLESVGISATESLIYPLKIDLRTGFTSLAALRTPVIFLVRQPQTPLHLAWTFVLHEPVWFDPNGVFTSTSLERDLAQGGRLAGEIRALLAMTQDRAQTPVDVAVSPVLLADLAQMRPGYSVIDAAERRQVKEGTGGAAAAAKAIADLRQIVAAPEVEVSALPFAAPNLPSLSIGGLSPDLATQLQRGRDGVETILGRQPDPGLLRPPDSALDPASLDHLAARGVRLLIVDPSTVPPASQPLGFAPPPITSLRTSSGQVTALVSDPNVEAMLGSDLVAEDPVRAAQAVLGELAAIWLEQPGVDRGMAITFPEEFHPSGAFFGQLVQGVAGAPWLRKSTASEMAEAFPPTSESKLAATDPVTFPRTYVDIIKQTRRWIETYRSMLVDESAEPDRLDTKLLLAESGQFLADQSAGLSFVGSAREEIGSVFGKVRPDTTQPITLTSSSGSGIPIPVTNGNREPLRVSVRLVSPHLSGSPQSSMVLKADSTQIVNFDVQLNTSGRFRVDVEVTSPSGRVINTRKLIVRSTAYNRFALFITIGAALLALLVWARRFVPRRTS
ncbi:MAG TPA: DUF6049 family protein [Actinomycetota bacterium]|nr:DUF6049 family protein [Actinomycetota bacterium]